MASNGRTSSAPPKDVATVASELWELLVAYAKQETIDPVRGLGRFIGYGTGAMVCIGIGGVLLTVSLLRVLQTETGTTFTGNWSWVPYLITLSVASLVIYLTLKAIKRNGARRAP